MYIEEKINEITGSIQKEQWRMRKENEACSEKHTNFLENLCFALFDVSESFGKEDFGKEEIPTHKETATEIYTKASYSVKPEPVLNNTSNISNSYSEKPFEHQIPIIPNDPAPVLNTQKEDDFLMDIPKTTPLENDTPEESILGPINGPDNVNDFTYIYQKYVVRNKGISEEIHISAFPLTTSKEECVNIPIVASIRYNGSTLNTSSLDNPENRASLICDLYDFKLNIRGFVDEKGIFHISVVPYTEGYELSCLTSDEHTNAGPEFIILTDTWEDKVFYAFPLNLDIEEFLIIAKSDDFTDYNIANETKSAPIVAYENDEDRSKKAFIKCQLGNDGYEFISKEL